MSSRPTVRFLDRSTPPHIVTLVLLAGLSAAAMNLYLPSLPRMTEYFQTDYSVMQLSVSLYLGINAVLQLVIGPISDRYGRRPVVLSTFALFCLFTLGTVFATTIEMFLVFRMGQAVVVSGIVLSRAIVRDMVSQEESASMIGYVTMGMAIIPMIGPAIGGVLDQAFGWTASFWFLFLMGLFVLAVAWADLGETAERSEGGFAAQMREAPELLKSPRFWGYTLTMMLASGAFFAYLGGAPFVGSEVFDLEPAMLGFFFGAPALGYMAGNAVSGMMSVRVGINPMVLLGTLITVAGLATATILFVLGLETVWVFFGFMTFVGLGNGLVLPNATAGMLSVRPNLAGSASGIGGAMMIGGGALLSSLAGVLLVPGSGALPLLWMMLTTSTLSVCSIFYVIYRARQIARR